MVAQPADQAVVTREEAADMLRVSVDTIDRNRVPFSPKRPPPGRYRYKMLRVSPNRLVPRIVKDDVLNAFEP